MLQDNGQNNIETLRQKNQNCFVRILRAGQNRAKSLNEGKKLLNLKVGDLVSVRQETRNLAKTGKIKHRRCFLLYTGLYEISEKLGIKTYIAKEVSNNRVKRKYYVKDLRVYYQE